MDFAFNQELANALRNLYKELLDSDKRTSDFKADPTNTVKTFLQNKGVEIPDPKTFHAHAIGANGELPEEPERATIDRYIYVFHRSGLFEYKVVPSDPSGNDDIMINPTGACCCCNCCVFQIDP